MTGAAWERGQHLLEALQYAKQFGNIADADLPVIVASVEDDVAAAFKESCIIRCVDALTRELLRHQTISGVDAEAFIASRITEGQRIAVREECCLSGSL